MAEGHHEMSSIKPIDATSVHRIHSGQVVLDLQGCLKELVENALDAGSTSVEVRIKDSGLSTIEVQDNGSGIPLSDWEFIGLKHHTSKLPSYDYLPNVQTFGFRGEALSALCALCDTVTIVTSTKETEPMGSVLMLGRDGRVLDSSGKVARSRGTTITLSGLFSPLPVRRKEFERNHKRELSKALTLLTAYALFPTSSGGRSIRFKVDTVNTVGAKSKRNTLLANDGRGDLRSSIISIWGSKALDHINEIDLELEVDMSGYDKLRATQKRITQSTQRQQEESQGSLDAEIEDDHDGAGIIKVKGIISSAEWGKGRTSADRQYFYINGRPAELKNVAKVINEVYKSFNSQQIPMAILNFEFPKQSVDINVSPDKRTILIHSESNFLSALRISLEEFYAPSRNVYTVDGGSTQSVKSKKATQSKLDSIKVGAVDIIEEEDLESLEEEEGADQITESAGSPGGVLSLKDESEEPISSARAIKEPNQGIEEDITDNEVEVDGLDDVNQVPARKIPIVASPTTRRSGTQKSRDRPSPNGRQSRSELNRNGQNGHTGTTATKRLRERLAMYSQTPISREDDDEDEDDGNQETENEVRSDPGFEENEIVIGNTNVDEGSNSNGENVEASVGSGSSGLEGSIEEMDETGQKEDIDMLDNPTSSGPSSLPKMSLGIPPSSLTGSPDGSPDSPPSTSLHLDILPMNTSSISQDDYQYRSEITSTNLSGEITLSFNFPRLYKRYRGRTNHLSSNIPHQDQDQGNKRKDVFEKVKDGNLTYEASISNKEPGKAEEALNRVIEKKDFERMIVLGQFNKGFIIARLVKRAEVFNEDPDPDLSSDVVLGSNEEEKKGTAEDIDGSDEPTDDLPNTIGGKGRGNTVSSDNISGKWSTEKKRKREGRIEMDDLYIIDQHASDEKYNFETLQRTTVIKGQALIRPRPLQLTAADELTAMENLDILKANGFEVDINEDEIPGKGERVKLVAMPISKETVFDFKDLEQLLHLLSDSSHSSGQMVRCSKARSMFAMRACRKSVMIGKSLTKGQMRQVLRNMGTIDQPWNCPHGRPTMRHLVKIQEKKDSLGKGRIDWKRWQMRKR